jgi:hypothetical protein
MASASSDIDIYELIVSKTTNFRGDLLCFIYANAEIDDSDASERELLHARNDCGHSFLLRTRNLPELAMPWPDVIKRR